MSISKKELQHIAMLARIKLSDKELGKFERDLGQVLEYVEALGEVNTDNVLPLAQVTGLENAFREDKREDHMLAADILENAPEKSGRFFRVKKVL